MSNEEKIEQLIKRIEALATAEKKRTIKKRVKAIYEITKIVIILILIFGSYFYINAKIIRPYKEITETINEKVSEKFSDFESNFNEKIDNIKSWFKE